MVQDSTTSQRKAIVILGGSYAGVSTAHYVLKHVIPKLFEPSSYRVVMVSTATEAMCRPGTPRALVSDEMFPQDKFFVNIPKQFEQYPKDRFLFVKGMATELDHVNRVVSVDLANSNGTEKLDFHALVIATGASTPSPLLSFNRDEQSLKASWTAFRQAFTTAKRIVISGGGPAGIEIAGELGEHLNGRAAWMQSKLDNPNVSITVVTSGSKILPLLRTAIAEKAERFLAQVGVTVIKNARVKSVVPEAAGTKDVGSRATLTLEDGTTLEADTYIPAFGMIPNTSFVDKSLLASDNRVDTDPKTLRVENAGPRIYAIGDAASWARPAVHNILGSVPVLGANIKRDLQLAAGREESSVGPSREFKEELREMQLVPIGKRKGVGAAMGWQLPSFLVWLIKGRDYWLWTTGDLWNGKHWAKET
ncbi:hypothetical protein BJ170DRAFT_175111 [Xylariales sp. AK1849]|nr:hypothetical protein BJ170DRAFT_175111 [Xylariales sp. AK1849]